jgi:hypothetical protein
VNVETAADLNTGLHWGKLTLRFLWPVTVLLQLKQIRLKCSLILYVGDDIIMNHVVRVVQNFSLDFANLTNI